LITVTVLFNELKASGCDLLLCLLLCCGEIYVTKWSRGSERMRLNALIVEVVCAAGNRRCHLHLPPSAPGFSIRPHLGNAGGEEGVGDTLAGRQTQRQPAVNY